MSSEELAKKEYGRDVLETIASDAVALGGVEKEKRLDKMLESLMAGDTIILAEGTETAVITTTKGGEKRSIKEPENQQAFRGSREGFIEALDTNISLVRRIIKTRIFGLKK